MHATSCADAEKDRTAGAAISGRCSNAAGRRRWRQASAGTGHQPADRCQAGVRRNPGMQAAARPVASGHQLRGAPRPSGPARRNRERQSSRRHHRERNPCPDNDRSRLRASSHGATSRHGTRPAMPDRARPRFRTTRPRRVRQPGATPGSDDDGWRPTGSLRNPALAQSSAKDTTPSAGDGQ